MASLTGTTIKGYELREQVGAGGFGAVYRAYQAVIDREVAMKIILPEHANQPQFIRGFEAEARFVARLEHPTIVPLFDFWRDPDGAFLVMRLLRGGSLAKRLRKGPLGLDETLGMIDQIASALHVAHRNAIVHRDLKPDNILLDEEGNAYLTDFGIAKLVGGGATDENISGSIRYIAPEQLRAEPASISGDLYSLGLMIYEMLTGRYPFGEASITEIVMKHLEEPLPNLMDALPDVPYRVNDILQKATAKDPSQRYQDARQIATELRQAFQRGQAVALDWQAIDPSDVVNPYKGLRAFQEADSADFFGREDLVERLLGRLSEDQPFVRFLNVVGPSGSGKSSAVRAGVLPALRQGRLPGSDRWFIVDMLPGTQPLRSLEAALLSVALKPPSRLYEMLRADSGGLLWAVERVLADVEGDLLLLIDQFEELFTNVSDEAERLHFLNLIQTAISDPDSRLRVIATLRADFTDRPLEYVEFGELVRQRTEFILPLSAQEIERAISGPAQRVGLSVESELVAAIVSDVREEPGALPLLQYALTEVFERREGLTLTLQAYQSSGGVLGALARRAEEVYLQLDLAQQRTARQMFLRLVTLGEGMEDTRRRTRRSEIAEIAPSAQTLQSILDAFGQFRLLTFDYEGGTREPTLEVAHEALIREWRRLRDWLDVSRGDVRLQRVLAGEANEWLKSGRDSSFLLSGARLTQYEDWQASTDLALTAQERDYIRASVEERQRKEAAEQARRQREEETAARAEQFAKRAAQLRRASILLGVVVAGAVLATFVLIAQVANTQTEVAQGQTQIAQVVPTLEAAEGQIATAQEQVAGVQPTLAAANAQVSAAQAEIEAVQPTLAAGQTQVAAVQPTLAAANAQVSAAQAEVAAVQPTVQAAQGQLSEAQTQVAAVQPTLAAGQTQVAAVQPTLDEAANQIAQANAQVAAVQPTVQAAQAQIDAIVPTLAFAETRVAGVEPTLASANTQVAGVQPTLDAANAQVSAAQAEVAAVQPTVQAAQGQLSEAQTQVAGVQPTLAAGQTQVAGVEPTLQAANAQVSAAQAEVAAVQPTVQAAQAQIDAIVPTLAFAETRVAGVEPTLQAANAQVSAAQAEVAAVQPTVQAAQAQIDAIVPTLAFAETRVAGVEPTLNAANTQVAGVQPTLAQAETQIAGVQPTLNFIQDQVVEQRQIVDALRLVRAAQQLLDTSNPDLAMALVLEAYRLNATLGETQRILNNALPLTVRLNLQSEAPSVLGTRLDFVSILREAEETLLDPDRFIVTDSNALQRFSADERFLALVHGSSVEIWSPATRTMLHRLPTGSPVGALVFSPDGQRLLGGLQNGQIVVWDAGTGEELRRLEGHTGAVLALAYHPDLPQAISGSDDRRAILWNVDEGQQLGITPAFNSAPLLTAFNANGSEAYAYDFDSDAPQVGIFRLGVEPFLRGTNPYRTLSPNGVTGVRGGDGKTFITLWDADNGIQQREFRLGNFTDDHIRQLAFSNDNRSILVAAEQRAYAPDRSYVVTGRYIAHWDVATGGEIRRFEVPFSEAESWQPYSISFSPDDRQALIGARTSKSYSVLLYDVATGREVRRWKGHQAPIVRVAFSPLGTYALSTSEDGNVRLWDASSGDFNLLQQVRISAESLGDFGLSADGARAFVSFNGRSLAAWDLLTGEELRGTRFTSGAQQQVIYNPMLPQALVRTLEQLTLYDLETTQIIHRFDNVKAENLTALAFSTDGQSVWYAEEGRLYIWDSATPRERLQVLPDLPDDPTRYDIRFIAPAPNKEYVALILGEGELVVYDLIEKRFVWRDTDADRSINSLSYSPDGGRLLTALGEPDNTLVLWDALSGKAIYSLVGHSADVLSAAFGPDGTIALSGGLDKRVILWDLLSGQLIREYNGHTAPVRQVIFSPLGGRAYSRSDSLADGLLGWSVQSARETVNFVYNNRYVPPIDCQQREQYGVQPACAADGVIPPPLPTPTSQATATITPTATPRPTQTPTSTPTPRGILQGDGGGNINIRSDAGPGFSLVTQAPSGTPVEILEIRADIGWLRVLLPDGQIGWVRSSLVQRTD